MFSSPLLLRRLASALSLLTALNFSVSASAGNWPQPPRPPQGAPNILVILLDDVGFADPSSFGGLADTPAFDRLGREGLRYNNFNTLGMCSPTRASLLTGHNHHRVGFGRVADWATPEPGYDGVWKKSTASIATVLRAAGYSTAAFGKWHNTPAVEVSPAGPFERWPTGLGFEYFYGFMNPGGDNQWEPTSLHRGTTPVEPPATPAQGYHLNTDLADDAIRWVSTQQQLAPDKPWFAYFATGATHAPHHVSKEWIARYRGRFDAGWDRLREEIFARQQRLGVVPANARLTPRPAELPAWDSLTAEQRQVFARQMEVYAAYLSHTDHEIGRLIDAIRQGPRGENTIVVYVAGDNGASAMAGPEGYTSGASNTAQQLALLDELGSPTRLNDYAAGWGWLGSTPFQWVKQVASHFGGLRVPMAVSWPARIRTPGQWRQGFTHVTDVVPTLLEAIGLKPPRSVDGVTQQAIDGRSFLADFGAQPAKRAPRVQYFEMLGNRALYADGWMASARHMTPWLRPFGQDFAADRWELYHLDEDFSQSQDLALRHPAKLRALKALFEREARANDVFPLLAYEEGQDYGAPTLFGARKHFEFKPELPRLLAKVAPRFAAHSFLITAEIDLPGAPVSGMLLANGSRLGGFALYLLEGKLVLANNVNGRVERLVSEAALPPGPQRLGLRFQRAAAGQPSGLAELLVNGQAVAQKQLPRIGAPVLGAFTVGRAATSPLSADYELPFALPGKRALRRITVDLLP